MSQARPRPEGYGKQYDNYLLISPPKGFTRHPHRSPAPLSRAQSSGSSSSAPLLHYHLDMFCRFSNQVFHQIPSAGRQETTRACLIRQARILLDETSLALFLTPHLQMQSADTPTREPATARPSLPSQRRSRARPDPGPVHRRALLKLLIISPAPPRRPERWRRCLREALLL